MKYFIDTEFLEGTQTKTFCGIKYGETPPTIDLISIGIVAEDGREYYAISKDFNLKEAWNRYDLKLERPENSNKKKYKDYWIRDNVCKMVFNHQLPFNKEIETFNEFKNLVERFGKSNNKIAEEIIEFCSINSGYSNFDNKEISNALYWKSRNANVDKTISEYGITTIFDGPPRFYGYYSDYDWVVFCWLFGKMIDLPKGFPMYCIDLQQESDRLYKLKKEEYVKGGGKNFIIKMSNHPDYPKQINEHNALSDARWNKKLYEFLNKI